MTDLGAGTPSDNPPGASSVRPVTDVSEFDDIPGTTVFTAQRSRKGYWLNQFCMSLMKPENRARFKATSGPISTSGR